MKNKVKVYFYGMVFTYFILVLDNFNWSLMKENFANGFLWIFYTEFTNLFDTITIMVVASLFLIPFYLKLKKTTLNIYGVFIVYFTLGFNKILFNPDLISPFENFISISYVLINWLTIVFGYLLFLTFYNYVKYRL